MSDYGLRIVNSTGKTQIDSTYVNYSLYEHGESVTTTATLSIYGSTVTFSTATAIPPLIAIKPGSAYCGLNSYIKSGANYTGFKVMSGLAAATFSWQAFLPNTAKSSETYGLRVYNSSGVRVFDSGFAPMIISDVDTCSPAYNATSTITHPSDSDAYFIMSPHGHWVWIGGWSGYVSELLNYAPQLKYDSATQITFGGVKVGDSRIPADITYSDGYWPGTWTIITVKKAF